MPTPALQPRTRDDRLSPPGAAYLLELVASDHGLTSAQLIGSRTSARHSAVKFEAAWVMRQPPFRYSWPTIAKTLGYAHHCSAIHAVARWERMRKGGR